MKKLIIIIISLFSTFAVFGAEEQTFETQLKISKTNDSDYKKEFKIYGDAAISIIDNLKSLSNVSNRATQYVSGRHVIFIEVWDGGNINCSEHSSETGSVINRFCSISVDYENNIRKITNDAFESLSDSEVNKL